jgi:hypothetical protein
VSSVVLVKGRGRWRGGCCEYGNELIGSIKGEECIAKRLLYSQEGVRSMELISYPLFYVCVPHIVSSVQVFRLQYCMNFSYRFCCMPHPSQLLHFVALIIKNCPATRHGGTWGERRYSSYSYLTSALDGVSGQRHAPAALYPLGKNPWYPLDKRLGGPQSRP